MREVECSVSDHRFAGGGSWHLVPFFDGRRGRCAGVTGIVIMIVNVDVGASGGDETHGCRDGETKQIFDGIHRVLSVCENPRPFSRGFRLLLPLRFKWVIRAHFCRLASGANP
jgi:hypothetical protein